MTLRMVFDCADPLAAAANRGPARVGDAGDVRRHLCPDRFLGRRHYLARRFLDDLGIFAHGRAHFSFGQPVGTGEVELERVDAHFLASPHNLGPGVLVILLHDGSDEDSVQVLIAYIFLNSSIQILKGRSLINSMFSQPTTSLPSAAKRAFRSRWRYVNDLGRIQADGLGDDRAPAFAKSARDHIEVGSGRAGANHEGVRKF